MLEIMNTQDISCGVIMLNEMKFAQNKALSTLHAAQHAWAEVVPYNERGNHKVTSLLSATEQCGFVFLGPQAGGFAL